MGIFYRFSAGKYSIIPFRTITHIPPEAYRARQEVGQVDLDRTGNP